jgi:hypothetical protein
LEAVCCLSVQFLVTQDTIRPFKKEKKSAKTKTKLRQQMAGPPTLAVDNGLQCDDSGDPCDGIFMQGKDFVCAILCFA